MPTATIASPHSQIDAILSEADADGKFLFHQGDRVFEGKLDGDLLAYEQVPYLGREYLQGIYLDGVDLSLFPQSYLDGRLDALLLGGDRIPLTDRGELRCDRIKRGRPKKLKCKLGFEQIGAVCNSKSDKPESGSTEDWLTAGAIAGVGALGVAGLTIGLQHLNRKTDSNNDLRTDGLLDGMSFNCDRLKRRRPKKLKCKPGFEQRGAVCHPIKPPNLVKSEISPEIVGAAATAVVSNDVSRRIAGSLISGAAVSLAGVLMTAASFSPERDTVFGVAHYLYKQTIPGFNPDKVIDEFVTDKETNKALKGMVGEAKAASAKLFIEKARGFTLSEVDTESNISTFTSKHELDGVDSDSAISVTSVGSSLLTFSSSHTARNHDVGDRKVREVSVAFEVDEKNEQKKVSREEGMALLVNASKMMDKHAQLYEDGTVVRLDVFDMDKKGQGRRSIYKKKGFMEIGDRAMFGVIKDGKITSPPPQYLPSLLFSAFKANPEYKDGEEEKFFEDAVRRGVIPGYTIEQARSLAKAANRIRQSRQSESYRQGYEGGLAFKQSQQKKKDSAAIVSTAMKRKRSKKLKCKPGFEQVGAVCKPVNGVGKSEAGKRARSKTSKKTKTKWTAGVNLKFGPIGAGVKVQR